MTIVTIEHGLLMQAMEMLSEHMPYERLAIVCDQTTYDIAAEGLFEQSMDNSFIVQLGKRVKASIETAQRLRRQVARCDAMLAVGSGTINDLCKYIAFQLDVPYACFATAPSMNGYVSPNASLKFGKQHCSVSARPPIAVLADMDILAEAPLPMIRAGIGDTLCRSTIESDLILAHHLFGNEYEPTCFDALRAKENDIRAYQGELYNRDIGLIRHVMEALIIGGQMMRKSGSSVPCSQGEHMVAHAYELFYGGVESNVLHGQAVSVATITMVRLQQKMIKRQPTLRPITADAEKFRRLFGNVVCESMHQTYQKKVITQEQSDALNDAMSTLWPQIRDQIEDRAVKAIELETTLKRFGCPTTHKQLKWHKDRYEHAVTNAFLTRDRFTFLDIAAMDKTLRPEI